jgi:hypothetical protein
VQREKQNAARAGPRAPRARGAPSRGVDTFDTRMRNAHCSCSPLPPRWACHAGLARAPRRGRAVEQRPAAPCQGEYSLCRSAAVTSCRRGATLGRVALLSPPLPSVRAAPRPAQVWKSYTVRAAACMKNKSRGGVGAHSAAAAARLPHALPVFIARARSTRATSACSSCRRLSWTSPARCSGTSARRSGTRSR